MNNRQAGGRFGDSGTDLDRERELRRRARWEPETFEAAVAELEREPSRLRWLI